MAALCLIAIGWAVFEFVSAGQMRAQIDVGRQEIAITEARCDRVKWNGRMVTEQTAGLKQEFDRLVQRTSPPPPLRDPFEAGRKFLAAHPEAKKLIHEYKEALANSWPMTAGRAAGFSDEQLKLFAAKFARQKGVFFIVDGVRLPDDEGALSGDEAQESGLKALVGGELYSRYQAYLAQSGAQVIASDIARLADETGAPLTPDQSRALLPFFSAGQQNTDWAAATQKAAEVLSPAQMAAWNSEKAVWVSMRAENAYRARAIKAAQAGEP